MQRGPILRLITLNLDSQMLSVEETASYILQNKFRTYCLIVWRLNDTRGSSIAERQARRSVSDELMKYRPSVVRITQTDRVSEWAAFSATATLYSATCIVLYTHRCTRHNYRTASIQCRVCHQQTSVQPETEGVGKWEGQTTNRGLGQSPAGVQGQSPWSGSQGRSPLKLEALLPLNFQR